MKFKKLVAMLLSIAMIMSFVPVVYADTNNDVILHYDFENGADDVSGNERHGTVYGNVEVKNGYACFDGESGSYIDMPDALAAGYTDMSFAINVRPEMGSANQFTFTLGNSSSAGYLFLNTNNPSGQCRFTISDSNWSGETGSVTGDGVEEGEWASIVVVMQEKTNILYIDGVKVSETEGDLYASSLGDTTQNYIGKSQYSGDSYFKGYIEDFAIYPKALSQDEVSAINDEHVIGAKEASLNIAADSVEFESYTITESLSLPETVDNVSVAWVSDNEGVITNDGVVTRPETDTVVKLTATFTDEDANQVVKEYEFTVIHEYSDEEVAFKDAESIRFAENLDFLKTNLYLPDEGENGSVITWTSSDEAIITDEGVVTRGEIGEGSKEATLTATVTFGGKSIERAFEIGVEEEDYAYLFAYFTGNNASQEKMFYSLSRDGYNFNTVNNSNPVLENTVGKKCLRDPFIMKGQNGMYYLLATDMKSSEGWSSQSSIVIWESEDLINWEIVQHLDFKVFDKWTNCNRAWAPQAIWDSEFYNEETGEYGAYMIYLALSDGSGGPTQMYKIYSSDMTDTITEPELLYYRYEDSSVIDSDIIYKDGLYYMYVKDESHGGIHVVTSEKAGGPYGDVIQSVPRKDSNGNDVAIEGSGIYKLIGEEKYNLVYDAYGAGFFIMTETEDLTNFTQLGRNEYSFDFTPRHGYVITLSKTECDAIEEMYGKVLGDTEEKEKPLVHYRFEDETDNSNNGYDATFMGNAQSVDGGKYGKGLYLDGDSSSFVNIPSEAIEGLEDYTIGAWINPATNAHTQRVFDFGLDTTRYMFFTPYYADGVMKGSITANSYTNENGIRVNETLPTNEWSHIVMSQTGDVMKIYLNGTLVGENTNVKLDPYELNYDISNCYIGKSQWSADVNFEGFIDEFVIYNRGLSDEEVYSLFEAEDLNPFDVNIKAENVYSGDNAVSEDANGEKIYSSEPEKMTQAADGEIIICPSALSEGEGALLKITALQKDAGFKNANESLRYGLYAYYLNEDGTLGDKVTENVLFSKKTDASDTEIIFDITEIATLAKGARVMLKLVAFYGGYEMADAVVETYADGYTVTKTGAAKLSVDGSIRGEGAYTVQQESDVRLLADGAAVIKTNKGNYEPNKNINVTEDTDLGETLPLTVGLQMIGGAQVRIGDTVLKEGAQLDAMRDSGLRFIATANYSDTVLMSDDVEFGIRLTSDGGESVDVPAEKFQNSDHTVFSAAITNLATSNFNRPYTANAYAKVPMADGSVKEFVVGEVIRSIYQVSVGIMKNSSAEADDKVEYNVDAAVRNVLNAYINQTGIRLTYNKDGSFEARKNGNGSYTGDIFFNVETVVNEDGSSSVTITPYGQSEGFNNSVTLAAWWDEYVRINNNHSTIVNFISNVVLEDGVLTFDFKVPGFTPYKFDQEESVVVVTYIGDGVLKGVQGGEEVEFELCDKIEVVGLSKDINDVVCGSVVMIGRAPDGRCSGIELLASIGLPVDYDGFVADFGVYDPFDESEKYDNVVTELFSKASRTLSCYSAPDTSVITKYKFESVNSPCYRVGIAMDGDTPVITVKANKVGAYPSVFESTANYHNCLYIRYNTETGLAKEAVYYCVPKDLNFGGGDGEYSEIFSAGPRVIIE